MSVLYSPLLSHDLKLYSGINSLKFFPNHHRPKNNHSFTRGKATGSWMIHMAQSLIGTCQDYYEVSMGLKILWHENHQPGWLILIERWIMAAIFPSGEQLIGYVLFDFEVKNYLLFWLDPGTSSSCWKWFTSITHKDWLGTCLTMVIQMNYPQNVSSF